MARQGMKPVPWALKMSGAVLAWSLVLSTTATLTAAPIELKELPLQQAMSPLNVTKRPLALGVEEKTAGLHVGNHRAHRDVNSSSWAAVGVFDDAAAAKRYATEGVFVPPSFPNVGNTCFSVQLSPEGTDVARELEENASSSASIYAEVPEISGYPRVALVRAERFFGGPNARLEQTDFWVDNQSGGLRVIRRAELALTQVGASELGLVAYAARTGVERFEVLVEQKLRPEERELYDKLSESERMALLNLQVSSPLVGVLGNMFLTSACGHLRFRLELGQPAPGATAGAADVGIVQQPQLRRESAVVSTTALLGWEYEGEPKENAISEPLLNRVRTRPLSVNFGLSRLSRDAAPVFSMSYRWTGPAVTQFVAPMRSQSASLL